MTETVLVTGGTGYIAGWCITDLLSRGYRVRTTVRDTAREAVVRSAVASVVEAEDRLSFAVADLTSPAGWDAALDGVDYVLHVASPLSGDDMLTPAREGVRNVLSAATNAGVKRVVMTSAANAASPSSYTEVGVTDETLWTDPEDPAIIPYRRSKTVAEKAAWDFMASYDGPMTLATVLPGAVLGPILSTDSIGSVQIIERMLKGSMPGSPRIGLEIVDVRDLVDIHIRAMTAPEAAGQRFLATGEFTWMREMARTLRDGLGPAGAKVSTRQLPDWVVRLTSVFDKSLRDISVSLGRRNRHTTEKAARLLDWRPRPAAPTVIDCANSLIAHGVV
ncbi:NAD-dependent epimerase/dehydratase family protein [Mycobacterium sp. AZCC_0083]|uniref:NAD-dependent epimerase/dehydratase family protein n=1 Tax=Mycobacterium sp. AZCC_0083 TaxID=2735882 RepID=UPI0016141C10|nr:NAD-dependent epimerase/dehydratase family protein [Mycobacterium sp. AZCC_0083]MBB5162548.1 nucleoside-diphosphate-sugar epimerase [Mycobacterium sp. AZCC_0083]